MSLTTILVNHSEAALGGLMIGISVAMFLLFAKRTTGLSSIMEGVITVDASTFIWKALYVLGLTQGVILAGIIYPEKFSFSLPNAPKAEIFLLGGFLVGFGTRLANGCTSGHGLVGTARFSPRSFVATAIFMMAAMAVATTIHHSNFVQFHDVFFEKNQTFEYNFKFSPGIQQYFVTSIGLTIILTYINLVRQHHSPLHHIVTIVSSILLGSGLVISGMALPTRIVRFLVLDKTTWDPSLAVVLGVAVSINVFAIAYVRQTDPVMAKMLQPSAKMDTKLILGSTMFGIGFGLTGVCPGPSMALASGLVPQILRQFLPGFIAGVLTKKIVIGFSWTKAKTS